MGADDLGQAALGRRAGHPLPARRASAAASRSRPGSPRYELGLQQKEDVLHRLVDVWATGEASASLGFAAARLFDELDPLERRKDEIFAEQGIDAARARRCKAIGEVAKDALEYLASSAQPDGSATPSASRRSQRRPRAVRPARRAWPTCSARPCKLWNTGHGANMMREAVSLMGGYGITEDCPGFLGHKWMDAQLEATYEGPEAVQRRQLSVTMTNEVFLAQFQQLDSRDARRSRRDGPGTGACTLATRDAAVAVDAAAPAAGDRRRRREALPERAPGRDLPAGRRAVLAARGARSQILDVLELEAKGPATRPWPRQLAGLLPFFTDLCHVQAARAAGEVGRICAELVFGYNRHPAWDDEGCATLLRRPTSWTSSRRSIPGHRRARARVLRRRDRGRRLAPAEGRARASASTVSSRSCACARSSTAA